MRNLLDADLRPEVSDLPDRSFCAVYTRFIE